MSSIKTLYNRLQTLIAENKSGIVALCRGHKTADSLEYMVYFHSLGYVKAVKDYANKLKKAGYEIERKRIELPGLAIKSVGNYHAVVHLYEAQVAEIKAAKEKLMESAQKVFAKMYENAQGAAGAGPDMGAGAGAGYTAPDDDIVDGDFREV